MVNLAEKPTRTHHCAAASPIVQLRALHCDCGFDGRMRVVPDQREIFESEIMNILDRRIQVHARQGSTFACELLAGLVEMVLVEVEIAKGMDEITWNKFDNLRYHHRE
jgi:hypothetical protein